MQKNFEPASSPTPKRADRPKATEQREKRENISFLMGRATEASPDHKERNEDAHLYSKDRGIIGVADGMGGVPAGEIASSVVVGLLSRKGLESLDGSPEDELCKKVFGSDTGVTLTQKEVEDATGYIARKMNSYAEMLGQLPEVRKRAIEFFNGHKDLGKDKKIGPFDESRAGHQAILAELLQNVGTTASFGKFWKDAEGKMHLTVGQVGDSRIYRMRDGQLKRLTTDNSQLQILVEARLLDNDEDATQTISHADIQERAVTDKRLRPLVDMIKGQPDPIPVKKFRSAVTQGIGLATYSKKKYGMDFEPQVRTEDVMAGDTYCAVTDGITDNILDQSLEETLDINAKKPERAAELLVKKAGLVSRDDTDPRAKYDDLTAVVVTIEK